MPVFNDFDFQIALARRRGANFVDILDSRSFATPVFRSYLCELSKRQNYGKTQHFAQFLPAKTSLLSNIDAARPTGNFQYSRKLELLNFLWLMLFFSLDHFDSDLWDGLHCSVHKIRLPGFSHCFIFEFGVSIMFKPTVGTGSQCQDVGLEFRQYSHTETLGARDRFSAPQVPGGEIEKLRQTPWFFIESLAC